MAKSKAKDTKKNTADVGFEDQLWNAADVLRGNLDAAEYKNVVLGLIFLKYLSDRFDERYLELVAEGYGDEEDRDCYMEQNVFFVPEEARWANISQAAHTPEIGQIIDNAMRAIERENDKLKDVLPKNFARPELDKRRLGDVVDLFTNVQMTDNESEKDLLGRAYEYCLQKFASMEGKNAGEFYTPSCIVRTLVEILQPFHGRVYDPCCGSGGMFVQSAAFVEHHGGNVVQDITIFGQESNPTTWKLAKMNLGIRGIEADLGNYADTFSADQHKNEKFDFVLANPPFNLKNWGGEALQEDVRWKYGTPPTGNANFAWMQHMIWHLNGTGKIGLVLANGSLSSQTSGEGDIRRAIVEDDLIEGIVAMPGQLFYSTQIPVCLWILNKKKAQSGKTLFIDAREMGTMVSRKLREFTEKDINKVAYAFESFREGKFEPEKGFSAIADLDEIAKQDFILTPGRYVGIAEAADDGEPFEEKMSRLTSEISKCFEESNRHGSEILSNKLHIENGDILVNKLNMRFKRIWPIDSLQANSVCSTEFVPLCPNEKVDRNYLLYILMSDDFTNALSGMRTGTSGSHQRVKPEWILDYKFPLPNIEKQREIGDFLSALDQKIAVNTKLNGYLEELLLAKYDKLFPVNADFTGILSDVGTIIGGATPSKKRSEYYCSNGIGWITPRDLSNTSDKFIAHGTDDITDEGYASCSAKLLPKGSVLFSSRAPIGYIAIAADAVTTNQGFKSIVPKKEIGTAFVYCFLVRNKQRIADMGAGTTFPEVSGKMMKSIELAIPEQALCSEFDFFAGPILKQQEALERENRELAALRDALLPKLMSGEIDVSQVDLTQINSHLAETLRPFGCHILATQKRGGPHPLRAAPYP